VREWRAEMKSSCSTSSKISSSSKLLSIMHKVKSQLELDGKDQ
jgi:hypothetical protein